MRQQAWFARGYQAPGIGRRFALHILDLPVFAISTILAFELQFDGALPGRYLHAMVVAMCVWAGAKSVSLPIASIGRRSRSDTSVHDAMRLVLANAAGEMLGGWIIFFLLGPRAIPRSLYILDWMVSCALLLGIRMAALGWLSIRSKSGKQGERTRTLIYGAGAAGLALLQELRRGRSMMCDVMGFVDDDAGKVGMTLHGKQVLGSGDALGALVRKHSVERLLIALPAATGPQIARILKLANGANVEYKMVPCFGELIQGAEWGKQIRAIAVEDLLGRTPVHLDMDTIRERIQGRVVMVTGAAGSIGSEICRQTAKFRPLALIGFDQAETPLFHLDREMNESFPDVAFHAEIGSIVSPEALKRVLQRYRPSILYHAAAYKHVPMMERQVFSAVETNVFGTWNVARAAAEHGVDDFVMISTDKAVRPTSMMGATKRMAELLIRALQAESGTKFVAVRFGNVMGSNGSVVPIFKEQIAAGGPVTVTHPEMRRYFMTISEAAQLVLQAFSIGKGGEIFALDMGEPIRIADLAENLILLSGLRPGEDIEIRYTGLRAGEKLIEELDLHDECLAPTSHAKIRSYAGHHHLDAGQLKSILLRLRKIDEEQDIASLVLLLKELIPEYSPGAYLLKSAMLSEPNQAVLDKAPVHCGQADTAAAAKLPSVALVT